MNPNRVFSLPLSLSLSVFTALIVACSAGAGSGTSGTGAGGTPLTPEQLMAYSGPAPKNLDTREGVWMSGPVRMELRNGVMTVASKCNDKVFGGATQAQPSAAIEDIQTGGMTVPFAKITVLAPLSASSGAVGDAASCFISLAEGTYSVVVEGKGAAIRFYNGSEKAGLKFSKGGKDDFYSAFTKIGD